MKIGELFVQIGVKDSEKAVDSLTSVRRGLAGVTTSALGVIAAITTAIYTFRKFGEQSNQTGMDLKNFESTTDTSIATLQRWQQLGIHAGLAPEAMTHAFTEMRSTMFKLVAGGVMPAGLARIQTELTRLGKGIDTSKFEDIPYMMGKLREFALDKNLRPSARMDALSSFVSEGVAAALMRSGNFNLTKTVPGYSARTAGTLAGMQEEWNKLIWNFQHSLGELNAKFGPAILKDIKEVSGAVLEFAQALGELNTVLPILKLLSTSIHGWALAMGYTKDVATGKEKVPVGAVIKDALRDVVDTIKGHGSEHIDWRTIPVSPEVRALMEADRRQKEANAVKSVVTNLNTTVNVDGMGKEGAEVGAAISSMLNSTFRQIPGSSP